MVIAHRGASADHVENTLAAFRGAADQGSDWVELDVRATRDGALVVHHDPFYADGRVIWHTPAAERPSQVPLLHEALDECRGMGVNIEIKNSPGDLGGDDVPHDTAVADAVVELVAARHADGADREILVSSFDEPTLARVRGAHEAIATALLVLDLSADPDAPARCAAEGDTAIHPWDPFVDRDLVDRCAQVGLGVTTWTVDDPTRIRELGSLGVRGVVTNRPGLAREVLGGR